LLDNIKAFAVTLAFFLAQINAKKSKESISERTKTPVK
jgi:hypothetical protein